MGVYKDKQLLKVHKSEEKTSEALPCIMRDLLEKYECEALYFVNGPGSFMAIKIAYIFLKSISIALDISLLACEAFDLGGLKFVRAFGDMYFTKEDKEIVLKKLQNPNIQDAVLPKHLGNVHFTDKTEPLYVLPAI